MISDNKKREIEEVIFGEARNAERLVFCQTEADPFALHYFVKLWNWDDGIEPLKHLVDNPACDKGTALELYWLSEPESFYNGDVCSVSECELPIFKFMKFIEAKFLAGGFAGPQISYDYPGNEFRRTPLKKKLKVPSEMLNAVIAETK